MRKVKLSLACSLDQFIAGPDGAIDWIRSDVDHGMNAFFASVDAALIGRATYDTARRAGIGFFPFMKNYVFSNSLPPGLNGEVEIISGDAAQFTRTLKLQPGKDIWLFGGHALAASLMNADLVDEIRLAIQPVLLGGGIPAFGALTQCQFWRLESSSPYPNGVVLLQYSRLHSQPV
jgi:dihydrofolate reductase